MKEVFSKIAVLQYAAEAQGITGRLKAEGIETFLAYNHSIDTDPLMSNAIGGIKLKVRWEDRNRTLQVYESTSKYYVDDEGRKITCLKYQCEKVEGFTGITRVKSFFFFCIFF